MPMRLLCSNLDVALRAATSVSMRTGQLSCACAPWRRLQRTPAVLRRHTMLQLASQQRHRPKACVRRQKQQQRERVV